VKHAALLRYDELAIGRVKDGVEKRRCIEPAPDVLEQPPIGQRTRAPAGHLGGTEEQQHECRHRDAVNDHRSRDSAEQHGVHAHPERQRPVPNSML